MAGEQNRGLAQYEALKRMSENMAESKTAKYEALNRMRENRPKIIQQGGKMGGLCSMRHSRG